jgi:hypothetical protein
LIGLVGNKLCLLIFGRVLFQNWSIMGRRWLVSAGEPSVSIADIPLPILPPRRAYRSCLFSLAADLANTPDTVALVVPPGHLTSPPTTKSFFFFLKMIYSQSVYVVCLHHVNNCQVVGVRIQPYLARCSWARGPRCKEKYYLRTSLGWGGVWDSEPLVLHWGISWPPTH